MRARTRYRYTRNYSSRLYTSAKRFQPFANVEMFLRMFTNLARKYSFCYSYFTK